MARTAPVRDDELRGVLTANLFASSHPTPLSTDAAAHPRADPSVAESFDSARHKLRIIKRATALSIFEYHESRACRVVTVRSAVLPFVAYIFYSSHTSASTKIVVECNSRIFLDSLIYPLRGLLTVNYTSN